jgi:hypothetical protein
MYKTYNKYFRNYNNLNGVSPNYQQFNGGGLPYPNIPPPPQHPSHGTLPRGGSGGMGGQLMGSPYTSASSYHTAVVASTAQQQSKFNNTQVR